MDPKELAQLYQRSGAAVERRCRALLGDGEEARDMVQEVFLRAVRSAGAFRGEASPTTWLYRITTNLCLNRLRDRKAEVPIEIVAPALHARGPSPEGETAARQAAEALLDGLDRRTREAVVYRYLDGMTQEEIARVTGWSRRTVGKRLGLLQARLERLRGERAEAVRP
jgi:RNA polymerase sigma-70 factor (ECF subfamily)